MFIKAAKINSFILTIAQTLDDRQLVGELSGVCQELMLRKKESKYWTPSGQTTRT